MKRILLALVGVLVSMAAYADLDYRLYRYNAFKACPTSENTVVFIGNSITNMGNWHEHFGDDLRVVNRGNSGAFSYEALENLETVLIDHPAKIFLMIGTNDIGGATGTPATIAANARAMIERTKNESPNTRVHIVSTFPSTNGLRNLENHAEINRRLKAVCAATSTPFIDLWDEMMGIVDNSISADRLHLTMRGFYIWSNAVAPFMGSDFQCTLPASTSAPNYYYWANGNGLRVNMLVGLPIKSSDNLLVGGCLINQGEFHELLGNPTVKNRGSQYGFGDYSTANWLEILGNMFDVDPDRKQQPARIFLNIGAGDIAGGVDMATIQSNYKACVQKLQAKAPKTKLYLMSLTPHTDATKNTTTKTFNEWLKTYAEEAGATYVDIFTPCARTSGSANPTYISNKYNGPYTTPQGNLAIARVLAEYIPDCHISMTDEQLKTRIALIDARITIGNMLTKFYTTEGGTATGQSDAEGVETFRQKLPEIYAALNDPNATAASLKAAATKFQPLVDGLNRLNPPTSGEYYNMLTKRGNRAVHMTDASTLASSPVADVNTAAESAQWQFVKREDGSWNILNRQHSAYLTAAITMSTTEPAKGWTVKSHNTQGTYAIVCGTAQLHQLTNGSLTSWGGGNNLSDEGCAFYLNLVDASDSPTPEPTYVTEPVAYSEAHPYVYRIISRRSNKVSAAVEGSGAIMGKDGTPDLAEWKFLAREDGKFDIMNADKGTYIDPSKLILLSGSNTNYRFDLTDAAPENGWEFKSAGTGEYILCSGSVQYHQTNASLGWYLINYGNGTNTSDEGCIFRLEGGAPAVKASAVTLSASELSLYEGNMASLTAQVTPDDAVNKEVKWTSSNPRIAVVDGNGLVIASGVGTAVVTASCGHASASCTVTVTTDPNSGCNPLTCPVDPEAVYDLQGRRVSRPTTGGVYISAGRIIRR